MKYLLALLLLIPVWFSSSAHAQDALVVQTCGTLPQAYAPGATRLPTVDVNGKLCLNGGGGGGGVTQIIPGTGISVSPPGGTGAVTVTNTGVVSLVIGSTAITGGTGNTNFLYDNNGVLAEQPVVTPSNIGTYVEISAGCGNSTGAGGVQVGTINSVLTPIASSSTAFPITVGNCGQLINLTSASGGTVSIPEAGSTGFPNGASFEVCNKGAGTQVIQPAGGTIGGLSSYSLAAGTASAPVCIGFTSDGISDYSLVAGAGSGSGNVNGPASSVNLDLAVFSGTGGTQIIDGGIATNNIVIGPAASVSGDVVSFFGTGGNAVRDVGAINFSALRTIFKGPIRVPVRTSVIATDYIFSTSDYFVCALNSSVQAAEILPTSPTAGDTYLIADCSGNAVTHTINILPAAGLIDNLSQFILNTAYQTVALTYTGSLWKSN